MSLDERSAVVEEARSWLGTPYHPHGRIKGVGVDCAMLPAEVYRAVGLVPHIEVEDYPMDWHLHRDEEKYLKYVTERATEVDVELPGNLVLYKWGRCFAHGAIIIQWPIVIHAFIGQGVVMADGTAGRLTGRERRIYSLWGD
jgi:cell wall-associated NlpC family hydrolase